MLYDPKWEIEMPVMEEWRLILLKAADLIRKHGLAKHTQFSNSGSMCIHGAISIAAKGVPYQGDRVICDAEDKVIYHLISLGKLPKHCSGAGPWNNELNRTASEVIEMLETVARS